MNEEKLREALARLADAAETYSADQSGATDSRCGLVQPITVTEGRELNDALEQAREALRRFPDSQGETPEGHICDYRCHGDSGHHAWPSPVDRDMPCRCDRCKPALASRPVEAQGEAGLRDRERAAYIFGREKSFAQGNQGLFHEYMAGVIVEAEELYPEAAALQPPAGEGKPCGPVVEEPGEGA